MTNEELIAALERAEGPSYELDCTIAIVSGLYVREKRGSDRQDWFYPTFPGGYRKSTSGYTNRIPRFTASLDAAMSLVPEGWGFQIMPRFAILKHPKKPPLDCEAYGSTPALALCIAALRARSHNHA